MPSNAVEPTKQGNLLEIELTISGGMLGIQNRTLFDFKTVPATLTVKKKPHFEAPEQTYRMVLTEEQAAQIKGLLSSTDIAAWSHAPTSEFVVLDRSTKDSTVQVTGNERSSHIGSGFQDQPSKRQRVGSSPRTKPQRARVLCDARLLSRHFAVTCCTSLRFRSHKAKQRKASFMYPCLRYGGSM